MTQYIRCVWIRDYFSLHFFPSSVIANILLWLEWTTCKIYLRKSIWRFNLVMKVKMHVYHDWGAQFQDSIWSCACVWHRYVKLFCTNSWINQHLIKKYEQKKLQLLVAKTICNSNCNYRLQNGQPKITATIGCKNSNQW